MVRKHVLSTFRHRPARRRRHSAALAVVVAVTLAAVASTFDGSASAKATAHAATKQLVIDTQYDQRTGDPGRDASISGRYTLGSVYDTLTKFKSRVVKGRLTISNTPVPWLAQSYSSNKAGNVWTFHLRKGLKFSNGDPLTSADVVFSLQRVKNLKGSPAPIVTGTYKSVAARGPSTVVITTKQPNPAVPDLVAMESSGIVNSKLARANGATDAANASSADKAQNWFNSNSAGSGPYMFQTFSNTADTVLVRNPKFWGPKPYYDKIVFRNVKPEIGRLDVQSGQAQMALGLTPDQAQTLEGSGAAKVYRSPSTTVFYLQATANPQISSLGSNPNLWEALRYGLDYPALVNIAGRGAIQACGLLPSQFLGALPKSACVKRDLTRARAALKRTGVANPTLTLEFPTDFTLEGISFQTFAEALQSQLKEIGFNAQLQGAPLATWLPRWLKGVQQLNTGALLASYPDPNMASAYLPTGFRGSYAGYKPTDAPDLTALGVKAQQTVDPKKRAALFRQLQQKWNTSSPFIPTFQPAEVIVAAPSVKGVVINPAYVIDPATLH